MSEKKKQKADQEETKGRDDFHDGIGFDDCPDIEDEIAWISYAQEEREERHAKEAEEAAKTS